MVSALGRPLCARSLVGGCGGRMVFAALLQTGLFILAAFGAFAQDFIATNALRQDFWDVDGTINAMVVTNGRLYVGGAFSYVAPKGRKIAAVDAYTGQTFSDFPSVFGTAINAITEDGNGGWFIGGKFTQVGALPRTNLVHVLSDNSVDPNFHPDPDDRVFALALDGNRLYVGGDFTHIAGQLRSRLAVIDISTGVVSSWAPQPDGRVSTLLVEDSLVYAGGSFTFIGGAFRNHIAALDATSGNASLWDPQADGFVLALGFSNGRLFAGGSFNVIGAAFRNGLAELDVNTGDATSWDPNPGGGKVTALKVDCNTAYVGGYFTDIGGVPRYRAAAIDLNSGLVTSWDPQLGELNTGNPSSHILALEVSGNTVYLGGQFSSAGGQTRHDLVAVDATTGQLLGWNPGLDGDVSALARAGRTILAGFLASPGGVERHNLAAFDLLTGKATDWNPGADGEVLALAFSANRIVVGGSFSNVAGQARQRLAAVDADSGALIPGWNPGATDTVRALAASGDTVFVGGSFTFLGGASHFRIAAVNATTGATLSWEAFPNGTVDALAISGGTVYIGGSFISVGAFTRHRLAALSTASGQVQAWNPDANQRVHALAIAQNGLIYAGGEFTSVGGLSRNHVAAIDGNGLVTSWDPSADDEVRALAVAGNVIYIGGIFLNLAGQSQKGLAAVGADGTLLDWNPGASDANRVYALTLSEQALFAGGTHDLQVDSYPSLLSLAAFPRLGAPIILQSPQEQSIISGGAALFSVQAAGQSPLFYQWRFNGINLPGATNNILTLTNVQIGQEGLYQVVVTNQLGAVTAEAALHVLVPVAITSQPQSQTFISNAPNTIVLSVAATGNPPPLYQWRLNGVNIPGAVFPTLTLNNPGPTSGGSYYVAVANPMGSVNSDIAKISIVANPLPFANGFNNRGTNTAAFGIGSGSNVNASFGNGEPNHAGKPGGKSVWLSWFAPTNGIATFSTRGSSFDTLLAIYTGTAFNNLVEQASDDDRGGFVTSRASFNAVPNVEYLIAVDGLAAASGDIVLSWDLDTSAGEFPKITTQPQAQTAQPGGTVAFSVDAFSSTPMQFQWFLGCHEIAGATNQTLLLTNVQARQAGNYRVVITNNSSRIAESLPAALEIGPNPRVRSFEKLEDLLDALTIGGGTNGLRATKSAAGLGGDPMLVSMGSIVSQLFNTSTNNPALRAANHCGVIGGHPAWLAFKPGADGVVLVDTSGSSFDTILSIYRQTNLLTLQTNLNSAFVDCDDNSAPDGARSLIRFPGKAGIVYLAVVDGVGGANGAAQIHWGLGLTPVILSSSSNFTARYGSSVTLQVAVSGGTPPPTYQWRLNGLNLPGATNSSLTVTNLTLGQAGAYTLVVSNLAGIITHPAANITVDVPLHLEKMRFMTNRYFTCEVWGNPGQEYSLEASTDLVDWGPLATNRLSTNRVVFIDTNAPKWHLRFYRVVP